jgi:hypothetical protein
VADHRMIGVRVAGKHTYQILCQIV